MFSCNNCSFVGRNINVTIEDLGVLGWIVASLIDFVMIFIGGFISDIIETVIKDLTNNALDNVDLGILGVILCE